MPKSNEPFYVGYLPMPSALKPWIKLVIGASLFGAVALSMVLASQQQDPGLGKWESSTESTIEGHLSVAPYPIVHVSDPKSAFGSRAVFLVSSLKYGASSRAEAMDGMHVSVKGHLISRGDREMFELADGPEAIRLLSEDSMKPAVEPLGEHTLVGEIVDSKCFLGVMKPGYGKTHRACAVRCIAGGIPPVFVTRDESGEATLYTLTDTKQAAVNEAVLPYVAEPVEVHGKLERRGDLLFYAIDAEHIKRR